MQQVINEKMTVVPAAITLAPGEMANFSAWKGTAPFRYKSTNLDVATIDAAGKLTANAIGETTVLITGSDDVSAESLKIRVANKSEGGGGEECPLEDPVMCQLLCAIQPDLPWCKM